MISAWCRKRGLVQSELGFALIEPRDGVSVVNTDDTQVEFFGGVTGGCFSLAIVCPTGVAELGGQ
jgi:hypothetical protein